MKNQKNILPKLVFGIALIIFCSLFAQRALALKRAIFPDEKALQPIPTTVTPNISGNVNNTTGVSEPVMPAEPQSEENNSSLAPVTPANENNKGSVGAIVVWVLVALALTLFTVFIFRNKKNK